MYHIMLILDTQFPWCLPYKSVNVQICPYKVFISIVELHFVGGEYIYELKTHLVENSLQIY